MTRFDRVAVAHDHADTGALNPDYWRSDHEIPDHKAGEIAERLGTFKPDSLSIDKIAEQRKQASKLVDTVGCNNGPGSWISRKASPPRLALRQACRADNCRAVRHAL